MESDIVRCIYGLYVRLPEFKSAESTGTVLSLLTSTAIPAIFPPRQLAQFVPFGVGVA